MRIRLYNYRQEIWYIGIVLSVFALGEQVRRGLVSALSLNFIFIFIMAVLLYINRKHLSGVHAFIILVMMGQASIINLMNGCSINTVVRCAVVYYLPLLLMTIKYSDRELDYARLCTRVLTWYNAFMLLIFAIYVLDLVLGGRIMKYLAAHLLYTVKNWVPNRATIFTRTPSYMGHYLFTAELYYIFFILNSCYSRICRPLLQPALVYIIYILGTLSTGSRTSAVIMVFMLLISTFWGRGKTIKIILVLGVIGLLLSLGMFDMVIARFTNKLTSTTSRSEAWNQLWLCGGLKLNLLTGYGMNIYNRWAALLVNRVNYRWRAEKYAGIALEYPILSNVFRFGLINAVLIVYYMILVPLWDLLRRRDLYIAVCALVLFLDLNTFNVLTETMDGSIVYMFAIMMLQFLSLAGRQLRDEMRFYVACEQEIPLPESETGTTSAS